MYNAPMPKKAKTDKNAKGSIQLNENQLKAVEHSNGPLLVVAGAGTGKTRVITERIKYLIEENNIKPQEILALTFTEKAAGEMLDRVGDIMPLGYEEPWIYTFHSFADRILKTEGLEIGLDTSYKILSEPDQWLLFRHNLFQFDLHYYRPLGNPTKFISAILKLISRLHDENIGPEEFMHFAQTYHGIDESEVVNQTEKEKWLELARVYQQYQDLKLEKSKMDFGDLITWTIKLFKERPNILEKYQSKFKHVLVDEFQDTNFSQYELIKILCPNDGLTDRSLIVVGDDSQAIYKFRGAAVSNILDFREDYKDAEMVTLTENYRSVQPILDASYKLIQNNNPDTLEVKLGISKKLISKSDLQPIKPLALQTSTIEDEVELVVHKIFEILGKEPLYKYKDVAVLARANNHLEPFVLAFRKFGIPYQLLGNRGLYDREEIRDIMALLKVLINPLDTISLYRVLNIDVLNIPQEEITKMLASARYRKLDLWTVLKENKQENVQQLYKKITDFQDQITKSTPVEIVYNLVSSINYISQFVNNESVEAQLSIKNMDLFLNRVKAFEIDYRSDNKMTPTLVDFIEYIELMIEAGENPAQAEAEDIDTVKLLTVHSSKGLEFPIVFMVSLTGDRFPTRERRDAIEIPDELIQETLPTGNEHTQEERRLFYVGMTRAQKYLFMTVSKNYGGKRDKNPSGFIPETGLKLEEVDLEQIRKERPQKSLFDQDSGFREAKAQKIDNFTPSFLSYTQISTYLECPLKYKYSYVLNIPTPPNAALSFGSTIHDTLRDFHTKLMFDKVCTLEDLMKMYERNWQPLGFINEGHRKAFFDSGVKLLTNYYEKNINSKCKPLEIEKGFNIKIDGLRFYGRIDRIDPLEDGTVEIIDYKTGNPKSQKEVDNDDQVSFYAIGAEEALNLKPKKLSLYYVESGEKVTTTRTPEELKAKKEQVKEVIAKIKSGAFESKPGMHCKRCDYREICPYAWKE